MNPSTTSTVSPLRQRMLDDMRLRKLDAKTQSTYIRAVRRLAMFLGRSPDTVSGEDLRGFQLHLVDTGLSPVTINATITGLKFFCEATLRRPELIADMHPVRVARTLPARRSAGWRHAKPTCCPGGGLASDGHRWIACRPGFFLSVRVLSRLFRRRFLEALLELHRNGRLQFFGEHAAFGRRPRLRPVARTAAPVRVGRLRQAPVCRT